MVEITIQVPEALAERIAEVRDRLPEVLAVGLRDLPPLPTEGYRYVLEFLASNPSPQAIVDFDLLPAMQARASELLTRERASQLTAAGAAELDEHIRIDNLLSTLKTGALKRLKTAS